jgi:peptidyl-prolyl cis-trans isomerase A (cyclophilin A)
MRSFMMGSVVVASLLMFAPVAAFAQASAAAPERARAGLVPIRIETTVGVITADLDSAHAPISVTNFLRYVDSLAYDGGVFHRAVTMANQPRDSVRIEVIQGGANPSRTGAKFAAIPLERTNVTGLRHHDGTLSMARAGPNTATSDFFICIGEQPALDFAGHRNLDGQGFAAFGQVTSGMDVVRAIQRAPVTAQTLTPPIGIVRVVRVATSSRPSARR